MMLLRSAKDSDLEQVLQLAQNHGLGITTLANDEATLHKILRWSTQSFHKKTDSLDNQYYFFVLEDTSTKTLVGTSAIKAYTGFDSPFYSYKLSRMTQVCHALHLRNDHDLLFLVNDYQGCSELCTLLLAPDYRGKHNGVLLSKGRFLFMAQYPKRFASTVIAEMRGIYNEADTPPFWQHVGSHFFNMPFNEADRLVLKTNKQYIADLMPQFPVYVSLLPQEAQEAIGQTHKDTTKALTMLLNEGFQYKRYVHIFDAGPTIEAPFSAIRSIAGSSTLKIASISESLQASHCLIANNGLDFRAIVQVAKIDPVQNSCTITQEAADLLKVGIGDNLRVMPLD